MARGEKALDWLLRADAGITALVAGRIYPVATPQDAARPFLLYRRISSRHHQHLSGGSEVCIADIELACVADTYSEAVALADAVREVVDGYRGTAAYGATSTTINSIRLQSETDESFEIDGRDMPLFACNQTYTLAYEE